MPEPEAPRDATQPAPALPGTESLPAVNDPTGGGPPPGAPQGTPARIGRYEVRALLGNGGFGRVYRGFDELLKRDVAIKVPLPGLSAEFRERFLREARAAATIRHTNVCPIYDVGTDGDLPFLVMHFVTGGTLDGLIAKRKEPFPPKQAAIIVRKLAMGVAVAHARGIIHRDLKPQNVLVEEDGDNREVLVTDFGLARIGPDPGHTSEGAVMGTPTYMALEQFLGEQTAVGPRADVYSLGVILYELLVGKPPFTGNPMQKLGQKQFNNFPPPAAARPGLDPRVCDICLTAMARDQQDRYPTARALADALEGYLRGTPDTGERRPPPPLPPLPPGQTGPLSLDEEEPPPDPDDDIPFAEEEVAGTEVLACPGCRARLQAKVGRTAPVRCPRCATQFAVETGRFAATLPAQPARRPKTAPHPKLADPPAEKPRPKPRPPRRHRVARIGCVTLALGAVAVVGFVFQTDIRQWAETVQPRPVEFERVREFQPGADEARVYGFLPGDPPVLLTNTDNKDVVAAAWDATTGKKRYALRNCPPDSKARLDPQTLRFRLRADPPRLAAFHRDVLANDKGGVWLYDLPRGDPPADAPELTPRLQPMRERAWDVSGDQKWAVSAPGTAKVRVGEFGTTAAVELEVPGTTFRAVAFGPDGKWLVALDDESRLWFWNLEKGVVEKKAEKFVRLAVRPDWAGANTADLRFDPEFTRVTVATELRVGVWDVTDGRVVEPMKRLVDGEVLRNGYRLRAQTAGKGTFSVFHDAHTLRAAKLTVSDGDAPSWCLTDDRSLLAAASRRAVTVWRLKYPPK